MRKQVTILSFLLVSVVGLLAACTSNGTTSESTASSVQSTAKTLSTGNEAKNVTITVGYQTATAQTWGALIIKNLGLFEKNLSEVQPNTRFSVEWFNAQSGAPLNNNMVSGKIQIAFMGDMPLLSNGAIGVNNRNYDSVLLAFDGKGKGGKNQSILVPVDGAKTLAELRGKTVATPIGSSAHRMLLTALEQTGLSDQVKIVDQSVSIGLESLKQHKIAAYATWEPYPTLAVSQGTAKVLLDGAETGIDYLDGVVADRNWVKANPVYTKAFLRSLVEAHLFIRNNPQKAAEIFAEESGFPLEVCQQIVKNVRYDSAIYQRDLKTLEGSMEFLVSQGKLKPYDLTQFVDDSYLRKTIEEMGMSYLSDQELSGEWSKEKIY